MRAVVVVGGAAVLLFVAFSPWTSGILNVWAAMAAGMGGLAVAALALGRGHLSADYAFRWWHPLVGVVSAGVLYALFAGGYAACLAAGVPVEPEVAEIYRLKAGAHPLLITGLLLAWIGPAEEVFWRGFVQERVAARWGSRRGYLAATLVYAAVHALTFNPVLAIAAIAGGLVWGGLRWKTGSVWPGLVSHAVWAVAIFVVFPLQ
jgi:membrane protease YdiL (CAAX protease family)